MARRLTFRGHWKSVINISIRLPLRSNLGLVDGMLPFASARTSFLLREMRWRELRWWREARMFGLKDIGRRRSIHSLDGSAKWKTSHNSALPFFCSALDQSSQVPYRLTPCWCWFGSFLFRCFLLIGGSASTSDFLLTLLVEGSKTSSDSDSSARGKRRPSAYASQRSWSPLRHDNSLALQKWNSHRRRS